MSVVKTVIVDYSSALVGLGSILTRYKENDDILSVRILEWGTDVLNTVSQYKDSPFERVAEIAKVKFEMLFREILIDPYHKTPLQNPILERRWTWEKSTHEECRLIFFNQSPFDHEAMLSDPPEHHFAKEMIHWMNARGLLENRLVPEMGEDRLFGRVPELKRAVFLQRAQISVQQERNRELEKQLVYVHGQFDRFVGHIREKTQRVTAMAQERAAAHEEALRQRIEIMNKSYGERIETLQSQLTESEEAHQLNIATLEQRLVLAQQCNEGVVTQLREQIEASKREHREQESRVHEQIEIRHQEQLQAVGLLQVQLADAHRAQEEAIDTIGEVHRRTVGQLEARIAEEERQKGALGEKLHHNEAENLKHMECISRLEQALSNAQIEELRIRSEMSGLGHGSCTIL